MSDWCKYGVRISLPKLLDPLPMRIKVKYGNRWWPTFGWTNDEPKGWWVYKRDGMLELMRCKRVKRFRSNKPCTT